MKLSTLGSRLFELRSDDARSPRLGLWMLLLGYLFVCAPTAYPGYWQGQEGFVPVFNVAHSGTIASLVTTPDLLRGIGRGAFLLAQPMLVLGATPVVAVRITFALALLLGGLGLYVWLHPRLGDRAAGLAGLIYLMMPPILATVYLRGSVADAMIVALLPLALAGIASYCEGRSLTAAAVVVLSVLWMWRCQAGLAIFATLILIAYAAVVERSRLAVLVAVVSGAAGLVSLVPIWGIRASSAVIFADHFVNITQLLASGFQPEAFATAQLAASSALNSTSNSTVSASPLLWHKSPYYLGFAAVYFGVLGVWLWTRRVKRVRDDIAGRLLRFSWIAVVVTVLLVIPLAAPLWSFSRAHQLLTYPWQLLLVACPFFAAAAGSLPAINPFLTRTPLWLGLVMLVMLSSFPYLIADYTQFVPPERTVATFGDHPDLALLDADLHEDPATGQATLDVTWQVLQSIPFDYNIFFQAVSDQDDQEEVVAQLDSQPRQGIEPATSWVVGQIMTDTYQLQLPNPLPEGELRYYYGFYDWRDGTRLPVDGGIADKLILHGE